MEYTINNLSKIAGVSTRTLRYYDEIELLKPCRISSAGYRIYGENEVNILQQILFYKQFELQLDKIKEIITNKDFDIIEALNDHKKNLLEKQKQIEKLLNNIENTMKAIEGGSVMEDKDKFEGLKKDMIKENEEKYGKEIREKYGDKKVTENYNKFNNLTKEEFNEVESLSVQVNETLKEIINQGNSDLKTTHKVVELHKKWLSYFGNYPAQAHLGLGQMYVDDERFTEYYDKNAGEGAAKILRDAIGSYYNAEFDENSWLWIIKNN